MPEFNWNELRTIAAGIPWQTILAIAVVIALLLMIPGVWYVVSRIIGVIVNVAFICLLLAVGYVALKYLSVIR